MESIQELIELVKLEKIEENVFIGQNYQAPWKRVFGGQVLSQALSAANQTVTPDRIAHSMHAYFIIGGDISIPIRYEVDIVRDGGSFTTRRVTAIQKNEPIFIVAISYQKVQDGFDHQIEMPLVAGPEGLPTDEELLNKYKWFIPNHFFESVKTRPFEFRLVETVNPFSRKTQPPFKHIWFRAKEKVEESLAINQVLLAYVSDYNLLTTATLPHVKGPLARDLFMASLDHAMWFHREFRIDEWLLYALDSPSASNSRGFARGNVFTHDGKLVASTTQEGLIRKKK